MTTNDFVLSEIHELLALQRVLMEARYCEIPSDTAISASPVVADMHRKVLDAIIAANLPAGLSPANWEKWLVMDESRREWEIALRRASQYYAWTRISEEEKRSFVLCLFSPFKVSEGSLSKFLLRADEMASQ